MAANPCPNLGFNPVEGLPADVEATVASISSAATVVDEANALIGRLSDANDAAWRGAAGDAFRAHLDQTLSTDLRMAGNSLGEALALFRRWHEDLVAMTEDARRLDAEAGAARAALAAAEAELARAQANPDLALAGRLFDPGPELQAAQQRLDAATGAVRRAQGAVGECSATLESIRQRARELQTTCEAKAAKVAQELTAIASRYAPSEPDKGILDRLGDAVEAITGWYSENRDEIHQVLSTVSAASGVLALMPLPPVNGIAAAVSVVTGAGVLAMDLSDPGIQENLGLLMRGDVGKDSLGALYTVGLGTLSVLPGVGLTKAATEYNTMLEITDAAAEGGAIAQSVAKIPGIRTPLEATGFLGRHADDGGAADAVAEVAARAVAAAAVESAAREYER